MTDPFDPASFGAPSFDPAQLEAAAQQMQQQLIEAQEAISNAELTGTASAGRVQVTGNGIGDVTGLTISPELDRDDVESLSAVILEALADLATARREFTEQVMRPINEGPGNNPEDIFGGDDVPRTADGLIDLG